MTHRVNFKVYRYGKTIQWDFSHPSTNLSRNARINYLMFGWVEAFLSIYGIKVFKVFLDVGGEFPKISVIGYRQTYFRTGIKAKLLTGSPLSSVRKFESGRDVVPYGTSPRAGLFVPAPLVKAAMSRTLLNIAVDSKIKRASYRVKIASILPGGSDVNDRRLLTFTLLEYFSHIAQPESDLHYASGAEESDGAYDVSFLIIESGLKFLDSPEIWFLGKGGAQNTLNVASSQFFLNDLFADSTSSNYVERSVLNIGSNLASTSGLSSFISALSEEIINSNSYDFSSYFFNIKLLSNKLHALRILANRRAIMPRNELTLWEKSITYFLNNHKSGLDLKNTFFKLGRERSRFALINYHWSCKELIHERLVKYWPLDKNFTPGEQYLSVVASLLSAMHFLKYLDTFNASQTVLSRIFFKRGMDSEKFEESNNPFGFTKKWENYAADLTLFMKTCSIEFRSTSPKVKMLTLLIFRLMAIRSIFAISAYILKKRLSKGGKFRRFAKVHLASKIDDITPKFLFPFVQEFSIFQKLPIFQKRRYARRPQKPLGERLALCQVIAMTKTFLLFNSLKHSYINNTALDYLKAADRGNTLDYLKRTLSSSPYDIVVEALDKSEGKARKFFNKETFAHIKTVINQLGAMARSEIAMETTAAQNDSANKAADLEGTKKPRKRYKKPFVYVNELTEALSLPPTEAERNEQKALKKANLLRKFDLEHRNRVRLERIKKNKIKVRVSKNKVTWEEASATFKLLAIEAESFWANNSKASDLIRINGQLTVPRFCRILRKFSDECEKIYLNIDNEKVTPADLSLFGERELGRELGSALHLVGGGAVTALIYFCEKIVYNLNFIKWDDIYSVYHSLPTNKLSNASGGGDNFGPQSVFNFFIPFRFKKGRFKFTALCGEKINSIPALNSSFFRLVLNNWLKSRANKYLRMVTFDDARFSDYTFAEQAISNSGSFKSSLKFLRSKVDCLIEHKVHLGRGSSVSLKFATSQPDGSLLPVIQKFGSRPKIRKKLMWKRKLRRRSPRSLCKEGDYLRFVINAYMLNVMSILANSPFEAFLEKEAKTRNYASSEIALISNHKSESVLSSQNADEFYYQNTIIKKSGADVTFSTPLISLLSIQKLTGQLPPHSLAGIAGVEHLRKLSRRGFAESVLARSYFGELEEFNTLRPLHAAGYLSLDIDAYSFEEAALRYNLSSLLFKVYGIPYEVMYYPLARVFSSNDLMQGLAHEAAEFVRVRISNQPKMAIWLNEFAMLFYTTIFTRNTETLIDFMALRFRIEYRWSQPLGLMFALIRTIDLRQFGVAGLRFAFHGKFGGKDRAYRFAKNFGANPCLRNSFLTGSYSTRQILSKYGITQIHIWLTYYN